MNTHSIARPEGLPCRPGRRLAALFLAVLAGFAGAGSAAAQITPAAAHTPPDDTPSIKVGAVIFADYTFQQKPEATDADGNTIHPNAFNVARSYINITGNLSHIVAFRITPDVTRESGNGSSLNGSMTFRIKYAYGQINLDDWLPRGTWVRFGIQQTPFIDSVEGVYRYRFQGTLFPEREGYMSSADAGVSFRTAFPGNYGDVHVGLYNGEGYSKAEANDQKSLQVRVGFRPLPRHPVLRGWRVQGFYTDDHVVEGAERKRAIFNTTFEWKYANLGFDFLDTRDQPSAVPPRNLSVHGRGWSAWATPKLPNEANGSSWEVLLRYDRMKPNQSASGISERTIAGVAYWFPKQGAVASALLFDVERVHFSDFTPSRPTQQRIFVHGLLSF